MFPLRQFFGTSLSRVFTQEVSTETLSPAVKTQLQASKYKEEYCRFFSDVEQEVATKIATLNGVLTPESVMFDPNSEKSLKTATVARVQRGGAVITYLVRLGMFQMHVVVLHAHYSTRQYPRILLKKGAFGHIVRLTGTESWKVAKRISLRSENSFEQYSHPDKIEIAILEYAFCRLSSALGVGPKVVRQNCFDVICFEDCIQFGMEYCEEVANVSSNPSSLNHRIKYCLRLLHSLNLIHKDIKPSNIVYSKLSEKFMLIDFGVSHPVAESLGQLTLTYKDGTPRYMLFEMRKLESGRCGYIDLYWNDANALVMTLDVMNNVGSKGLHTKPRDVSIGAIQDKALRLVYRIYTRRDTGEDCEKAKHFAKTLFSNSFPELALSLPLKWNEIIPKDRWNLSFLLRVFGVTQRILPYLELCNSDDLQIMSLRKYLISQKPILAWSSSIFKCSSSLVKKFLQQQQGQLDELKYRKKSEVNDKKIYQTLVRLAEESLDIGKNMEASNYLLEAKRYNRDSKRDCFFDWLSALLTKNGAIFVYDFLPSQEENTDFLLEIAYLQYGFREYTHCLQTLSRLNSEETKREKRPTATANRKCLEQALTLLTLTNNIVLPARWISLVNFAMGGFVQLGLTDILITNCKRLMQLQELTKKQRGLLQMFAGIGYSVQQLHQEALSHLMNAMGLLSEEPSSPSTEKLYIQSIIALVYERMGEYEAAIEYHRQILAVLGDDDSYSGVASHRLAVSLVSVGELELPWYILKQGSERILRGICNSPDQVTNMLYVHTQLTSKLTGALSNIDFSTGSANAYSTLLKFDWEAEYMTQAKVLCLLVSSKLLWEIGNKAEAERHLRLLAKSFAGYLCASQTFNASESPNIEDICDLFLKNAEQREAFSGMLQDYESANTILLLLIVMMLYLFQHSLKKMQITLEVMKGIQSRRIIRWMQCNQPSYMMWRYIHHQLQQQGQHDICLAMCEMCELRTSRDYLDRGLAHYRVGKYQESLLLLQKAKSTSLQTISVSCNLSIQEAAMANITMADICSKLQQKSLSQQYCKTAVESYLQLLRKAYSLEIIGSLVRCLDFLGEYTDALKWARRILTKAKGRQQMQPLIRSNTVISGVCCYKLGLFGESQTCLSLALRIPIESSKLSERTYLCFSSYILFKRKAFWKHTRYIKKNDKNGEYVQRIRSFLEERKDYSSLLVFLGKERQQLKEQASGELKQHLRVLVRRKIFKQNNCHPRG